MSDEAVKKQVEGSCTEISEKNDWVTFNIDVGRQYPVRLSTKLEALVKAGREAKNNKAVWTFSESQGGENPNKPGTHYINRRLEKVEVGGSLDPAVAGSSSGASGGGAAAGGGYARSESERISIERQSIVKSAIAVFPTSEIKTIEDWFQALDRLDDWMARDRPIAPAAPAAAPAAPAAQSGGDPAWPDAGPEDDIPF
jgi:hypothetical protein